MTGANGEPGRGRGKKLDLSAEWAKAVEQFGEDVTRDVLQQTVINLARQALAEIVESGRYGPAELARLRNVIRLLDEARDEEP